MALEGNMSTIDQQFVEYIVKSLVGHPDDVVVERLIDEKGVLLTLTVNPEDLGRVIGKRGVTAQSLRTLLRALGTKNDARYNLKIIDNGPQDRSSGGAGKDSSDRQESPSPTSKTNDDISNVDDDGSAPDNVEAEAEVKDEAPVSNADHEAK